jgi:hypothetical protein
MCHRPKQADKEGAMRTTRKMSKVLLGVGLVFLLAVTPVGHAVAQTCIQPPLGLISWWPGDGNANDIQDGNNGTWQNGVTFAAGKVGQAFSFNGNSQYVNIPAQVYSLQAGTTCWSTTCSVRLWPKPLWGTGWCRAR